MMCSDVSGFAGIREHNSMTERLQDTAPVGGGAAPRDDRGRRRIAWIVAIGADVLQVLLLPATAGGLLSPLNDALDVVVAVALSALVGWHWAFLPTFLAELVPFVGLVPTWTLAAFIATRRRQP